MKYFSKLRWGGTALLLLVAWGCGKESTAPTSAELQKSPIPIPLLTSSSADTSIYEEFTSLLEELFAWYHNPIISANLYLPNIQEPITNVTASWVSENELFIVSGVTSSEEPVRVEYIVQNESRYHKFVKEIFYHNNKRMFGIYGHYYKRPHERMVFLLKYFPDESYNVKIEVEDPDPSIPLCFAKKFDVTIEFNNQSVTGWVSIVDIDPTLLPNYFAIVEAADKEPQVIIPLNEALFYNELTYAALESLEELVSYSRQISDPTTPIELFWLGDLLDHIGASLTDLTGSILVTIGAHIVSELFITPTPAE
ncbi:hypothetical protein KAW65_00555 [candidate division WOR-3 bacterium]|nr:hypothetical protein [candidate division WOR-3 bacterium]